MRETFTTLTIFMIFSDTVGNGYCDYHLMTFIPVENGYEYCEIVTTFGTGQNSQNIHFLSQGDSHNIRFLLYRNYRYVKKVEG